MSDRLPTDNDHDVPVTPNPAGAASPDLRPLWWQPIVTGGVALLVCAAFIGAIIWYLDQPVLVTTTGRVTSEGKPLDNAFVMSIPVNGGGTAVSAVDVDGKFKLETNGVEGAYTGQHKLLVRAFTHDMPPKPTIPAKYLDETTTPLTIHVKQGEPNYFEFEIEKP